MSKILKMNDSAENYRVHKENLFDLPMRLLVIGKSQLSGKTNLVGNLLLRPYADSDTSGKEFYKDDFLGRNIYIVCPSTLVDEKWRAMSAGKDIPDGNIYTSYDEDELEALYTRLEKDYYANKARNKPEHVLVIFDDCSYGGDLKGKKNGIMTKFACNSRHFLISVIITSQKHSDVSTTMRENASGLILYGCSMKQTELIYQDVGECSKTEFLKMFRNATHERHTFLVVNYSNHPDARFCGSDFLPLNSD